MARVSERARLYTKGRASSGYWGRQELKDILFDIHRTHKSWGKEWYTMVELGLYESAKMKLAVKATGEYRGKAMDIIDELMNKEDAVIENEYKGTKLKSVWAIGEEVAEKSANP